MNRPPPLDFTRNGGGFGVEGGPSQRSQSLENPSVSLVDPVAWRNIFGDFRSAAGVAVDAKAAMSVPSVWCAVTFLAGCLAHLPVNVHRKTVNGRDTLESSPIAKLLASKVNDEYLTSFNWRRRVMASTLLNGRGYTYVERWQVGTGDARYLWPLPFQKTTPKRERGVFAYHYRDSASSTVKVYEPANVIDVQMLPFDDGVDAWRPIDSLKDTIGLAIALRTFASRFFLNGGVAPLAMEGPAASPQAVARAKSDAGEMVKQSTRDESNIIYLPAGHKLTPVGFNPEKSQLLDSQRFIVEEVSRIYNLPPSFLHSLLNMPFATAEQQDLNLVKHCIMHWVEQWQAELNLKLFGNARGRYVEFNVDELLRGDFVSRIAATTSAIAGGLFAPNEARAREGLPPKKAGDSLYMNGAVVAIDADDDTTSGQVAEPTGDPENDPNDPENPIGGGHDPVADPDADVST
jgi:HK97 family phage portal protein